MKFAWTDGCGPGIPACDQTAKLFFWLGPRHMEVCGCSADAVASELTGGNCASCVCGVRHHVIDRGARW